MRSWFLIVSLLAVGAVSGDTCAFDSNLIEIDLNRGEIRLSDFNFGSCEVNGEFYFLTEEKEGFLILETGGSNITFAPLEGNSLTGFADKVILWLRARLIFKDGVVSIPYLYLPQFEAAGEVDLAENELNLGIDGFWHESSAFLEGEVRVKVKAWGGIGSFLVSGYLTVDGGRYKGKEFSYLRIDFLGRIPVLNIMDSRLVLKNGNVVEIKGVLDLRDFSNILPGAEFSSQKVFIDQWQLFSGDDQSIGLKKQLDERIGVSLNTNRESETTEPRTELLYNLDNDKFLKLRMEEERTTFRFERRRDF